MFNVGPILILFLLGLLLVNVIWFLKIRKQRDLNNAIIYGIEVMAEETQEQIVKNQKLIAKAREVVNTAREAVLGDRGLVDERGLPNLESPAMLSTLITVLIRKYGTTALGLSDFGAVNGDDFVSVYVDSRSGNIILSLDDSLGVYDEETMIMNLMGLDDNTFN